MHAADMALLNRSRNSPMHSAVRSLALACSLLTIAVADSFAETADVIYHGGDVVTIDDRNPTAEAVAIKDGKIIAVGKKADVLKLKGENTKIIDLDGKTLLPGFVDGHGHCMYVGVQAASANLLAPPDHTVKDIAELQAELKKWAAGATAKKFQLILGFGYDDAQLKEQRHPTRHELDEVSQDLPVLIIHQSSHLAAMNTKALELAGVTADTKNPPGGVIRREKDGKTPDGVLEETAFMMAAVKVLPKMGEAELDSLGVAGQRLYAANGYTFAQEGRSNAVLDKTWMRLAEGKKMLIDVASYPDLTFSDTPFGIDTPWYSKAMKNGYRIAGVKLSFDGSPQGKTAFLSQPYFIPPHGQQSNFRGYPTVPAEEVNRKVALCYEKGWQFLAHCNGDAAGDMMIGAVKDARAKLGKGKDRRDVMIHCQTVREDQLDAMQEYGLFPSMFGMHCFYWGDWHRDSVLGAERAERISPARSALRRGMIFSQHHDAPVALPSAIRILASVVTRRTRSGDILGAGQCIDVNAALKSLTLWAAYQHYEEANRGSIEVGKLADFVVLDKNPHRVPISELEDLKVLETIKEGKAIYNAR
ncbi:MAG: amidohydrolase [Planctomycetaceae bacterium]|nr:amidohydrolase [Planctomycetaceae bacterium]